MIFHLKNSPRPNTIINCAHPIKVMVIYSCLLFLFCPTANSTENKKDCDEFYNDLYNTSQHYMNEAGNDQEKIRNSAKFLALLYVESAYACRNHSKSMILMSNINLAAFKNDIALEYAKAAVVADRKSAEANRNLGEAWCLLNRFDIGLPYIEKSTILEPKNWVMMFSLCSNYELAGKFEKAIESCNVAIELAEQKTDKAAAIYVKARAYKGLGNQEESSKFFSLAKSYGYDGDQFYTEEHFGKKSGEASQH